MKAPTRLTLVLLAGLSLAGCASKTASIKEAPALPATPLVAASWGEKPLSGRDYWMMRDLNDRYDRIRNQP